MLLPLLTGESDALGEQTPPRSKVSVFEPLQGDSEHWFCTANFTPDDLILQAMLGTLHTPSLPMIWGRPPGAV